jgi:YD repeat-containing protein
MSLARRVFVCLGCCLVGLALSPVGALGGRALRAPAKNRGVAGESRRALAPALRGEPSGSLRGLSGFPEPSTFAAAGNAREQTAGALEAQVPAGPVGPAAGGFPTSAPTPPSALPFSLASTPFVRGAVTTPAQAAIDARSRTAYAALDQSAATSLAERTFHLRTPSWTAPGTERGSRITRYLSDYTAREERLGGKHVVVQSTIPLRMQAPDGQQVPVSTTLRSDGDAFTPASPLVPFSISKNLGRGVLFSSSGISVAPLASAASEAPVVVGNRVMWTNTALDTDFIAEPLPGGTGVEDSWQLRAQRSPSENSLVFTLPPGAKLVMSATARGAAEVRREGRALLTIPTANALSADGAPVPVSYSVDGDTLTTHVDLGGNVDFPVLVDPEIIADYGEADGVPGWPNWYEYTTDRGNCSNAPGFCFMPYTNLIQVGTNPNAPLNSYGEWYTGVASSSSAGITRVDVSNVIHEPANQSSLQIGIGESNGSEIYTTNGYGGASGPAPLVTASSYYDQPMAFCADGAGGHDGGEPPLCNESYGGKTFYFLDDIWQETQTVYNYVRISAAAIRYIQSAPPTLNNEVDILNEWSKSYPPYVKVRGEDSGLGIAAVGLDAVSGEVPLGNMPSPGSSPAPGTSAFDPSCNDPFCPTWASDGYTVRELPTGIWTLGAWTRDAVGLTDEQTYHAYIDKTPPTIETPPWEGQTFSDGAHELSFSAKDGSASAPQSGVRLIHVYIDGTYVKNDLTSCPEPKGANLIPSESCLGLKGSWTLQGEDYGAGPHTIRIWSEDWAGNTSERSFKITIDHPVGNTQQLGPGTLNLRSGDFTLGDTDVSVPAGAAALSVARSYSSQSVETSGPVGPGWLLSLPDTRGGGQWQSLRVLPEGQVEVTTTSDQKVMFVPNGHEGFTSPTGYQTYTLSEPVKSPVTYRITNPGGDYTQFTEPSGATVFMPTTVGQAVEQGGLNQVTYILEEGQTHEIVGPEPGGENCSATTPAEWTKEKKTEEEHRGCRVVTLNYHTSESTAKGEAPSEWGNVKGQLESVSFTAWNAKEGKLVTIPMARYEYDGQERLRAVWDPRVEPALKTVYGYDSEDHLTAITPPGQESWVFTYGKIPGDVSTGRLLKVTRAPASKECKSGCSITPAHNTEAPKISGSPVVGKQLAVSNGSWSNEPVAYSYQWEECSSQCTPILGATNANYTPNSNNVGRALVVQVSAVNGGGTVTAASAASRAVSASGTLSYTYKSQFGTAGTGNGQFEHPADVAIDGKGNLWVVDHINDRVQEFNEKGEYLQGFGAAGSGNGQLKSPDALAVDSKGNVWVADNGNHRVEEFNAKGEYEKVFGAEGSNGGQFASEGPEGIAVDSHGNLWVSNPAGGTVEVFNEKGEYLKSVGSKGTGAGQLGEPEGVAISSSGHVFMADWTNDRVEEFNEAGEYIREFGTAGSEPGQLRDPYGIAVSAKGEVLVADNGNNRIDVFNEAGESEGSIASEGTGNGQVKFSYPIGLATAPGGVIWVTDPGSDRLEKWEGEATSEGATQAPQPGWTVEYDASLSGANLPAMSKEATEKWGEKDNPAEATAVFPPDEPEGWPAANFRRATVSYFDSAGRLVNVVTPGEAVSTIQYETYDNPEWTLTPANRQRALEAGTESAKKAEVLATKSTYEDAGAEVASRIGPQHEVTLATGSVVQARAITKYYYEEGAPQGTTPYDLVTKTVEGALLENGKEEETRTVKTGYSGQSNLGWKLHKPTSTTAEPEPGKTLTRLTEYNSETGDTISTKTPAGSTSNSEYPPVLTASISGGKPALSKPAGVTIAKNGNVLVLDTGGEHVEEFSPSGEFLVKFATSGKASGNVKGPTAIAVDTKGNVWIADTKNDRVDEFNEKHEFVQAFGFGVSAGEAKLEACTTTCKAGVAGAGAGQLDEPEGIVVTSSGDVYVSDTSNNRIEEFTEKGEFIDAVGFGVSNGKAELETCTSGCKAGIAGNGHGQMDEPTGLAVSPTSGSLWVAEKANSRVQELNAKNEYALSFGTKGAGAGQLDEPTDVAIDSAGAVWVVDTGNSRVQKFSSSGAFMSSIGSKGTASGQFEEPRGIAFAASGSAYVVDALNKRVSVWTPQNLGVHESRAYYYTAGANSADEACGNRPEWAGLACQTTPAVQPQGSGLPGLPVTTTTYDIWDRVETSSEKDGSAVRTTTETYDSAGRVKESAVTSTSGEAMATVTSTYSPTMGMLVAKSETFHGKAEEIKSEYNTLGQLVSYTDGAGVVSSYEYDEDGRITKVNDGKGTQTAGYNSTTGDLTTLADSGAGTFTATYNPEGKLATETYPNGMTATYTTNSVGQTSALTYTKGSSTLYKDHITLSIFGQMMAQQSTLANESYAYDNFGRMTKVQEEPASKIQEEAVGAGCVTYLYSYDADSNRTSETKREPGSGGTCAGEGGLTAYHDYDEADRLVEPGTTYGPFGESTSVPAADAGGHALESSYYADGALYSQTQNGQTNTYALDPVGRAFETTETKGTTSVTTVSNYSGASLTPSWTQKEGSWTRNIKGIGGQLAATQTNGGEAVIEIANLHGDVIGTVPDNGSAETAALKSEPTAFGVPTSHSEKAGWLGASGVQVEFGESGIISSSSGSYIPQLGLHLNSQGLTGAAAQDPPNEYLANQPLAQPHQEGPMVGPMPAPPSPVEGVAAPPNLEEPPANEGEEEEGGEFSFDPTVGNCNMEVGIALADGSIAFSDHWECRRYNKSKHAYENIYVELYGYNTFGLAKTESFEASGYQGWAFPEPIVDFDEDIPFSEAGVCFKVRLKKSGAKWSSLSCFRAPVPPELLGPPPEE